MIIGKKSHAKTDWQGKHGWWVDWVEWPNGAVFFALNIDAPDVMKELYKRHAKVRDILSSIEALLSKNNLSYPHHQE